MYTALAAVFSFVWTAVPFVGSHSPCAPSKVWGFFFCILTLLFTWARGNVGFFWPLHMLQLVPISTPLWYTDLDLPRDQGESGTGWRAHGHLDVVSFPICRFAISTPPMSKIWHNPPIFLQNLTIFYFAGDEQYTYVTSIADLIWLGGYRVGVKPRWIMKFSTTHCGILWLSVRLVRLADTGCQSHCALAFLFGTSVPNISQGVSLCHH